MKDKNIAYAIPTTYLLGEISSWYHQQEDRASKGGCDDGFTIASTIFDVIQELLFHAIFDMDLDDNYWWDKFEKISAIQLAIRDNIESGLNDGSHMEDWHVDHISMPASMLIIYNDLSFELINEYPDFF